MFSIYSPENKFFDGGLAGNGFLGLSGFLGCVLVGNWGYPLPTRSIGIKNLAGFFWQSIEWKRLRGKVLIALDLGPLPLLLWAPGWVVLLPLGAGPPFRPEQKVKLDKTEARRGGLFLRSGFLGLTLELPDSNERSLSWAPAWWKLSRNGGRGSGNRWELRWG
jgi:hypothetical protein